MESVLKTIKENKLIKAGDTIGVAVSGGTDSMALLHYLTSLQNELDFEVVAITIDHSIRENSADDARFVIDWCREIGIRAYKFKVDAMKIAKEKNMSIETAAREARYGVFDAVFQKGIVDKIAIAHHMSDQAETILMRLFRGSGISGAKGMDVERDEFIRPMLQTSKKEISAYVSQYDIPFVQDETNYDDSYSRNFLRNKIMPLIEKNWPNAVSALVTFGKACKEDDDYINSQIFDDAFLVWDKMVKIPLNYFIYPDAIVSRMIFRALEKIGVTKDVERKHVELIKSLAKHGENGSKIALPYSVFCHKEYDYITIINKYIPKPTGVWAFKGGDIEIPNFGVIRTKRIKNSEIIADTLLVDCAKLPKNAVWRFREDGDIFEKFGGGTKKLKSFLIDKKIPLRERDNLPVLASNSTVYAIAGLEIADSVKVDENTNFAYRISVIKNN